MAQILIKMRVMGQDTSENEVKKERGATLGIIVALVAVIAAVGVFFWVRGEGNIPQMPRAHMSKAAQEEATAALRGRIKGFSLYPLEQEMVAILEKINEIEVDDSLGEKERREKLEPLLDKFSRKAREQVAVDVSRYLEFGDFLATQFEAALKEVLDEAEKKGLGAILAQRGPAVEELEKKGGSFLDRAIEVGAIGRHGELKTARITPQVLFRVKWRHMGTLSVDTELTPVEQLAYLDFTVRFSKPESLNKRLAAIVALENFDDEYDATIARALVLYEAGKADDAYRELKSAIDAGRQDQEILDFAHELQPG